MKNIVAVILLGLVLAGSACKKSNGTSPSIVMSGYVDNRPWVSYVSNVNIQRTSTIHIVIVADSANTHMKLDIGNYTGKGIYIISDSGNTASYTSYSKAYGSAVHKATSGQIEVTNNTSNGTTQTGITGTFQFLADTVAVTTGKFDVKLDFN